MIASATPLKDFTGVIPPELIFAENRAVTGLTREIANRVEAGDYAGLMSWLPNPDPILRKANLELEVYTELLSDAFTKGVFRSFESRILSKRWRLNREGTKKRSADLTEAFLKRLNFRQVGSEVLDAYGYGHSILEVMYAEQDGVMIPTAVTGKPRRWFMVTPSGSWRFLQRGTGMLDGVPLPDFKFLVITNEATYDQPYGEPLLSACYWPITLKRAVLKHWATERERFGMPWVQYQYPGAWAGDLSRIREQVAVLEAMVQDGVLAVPEGTNVGFTSGATAGGGADQYQAFMGWCNSEIAVAVLGHQGAATATPGALGDQASAVAARDDIIDAGVAMVEGAFNTLIGFFYDVNFPDEVHPRLELYDHDDIQMDLVTRVKTLAEVGVTPTRAYVENKLGLKPGDFELASEATPAPAASGTVIDAATVQQGQPADTGAQPMNPTNANPNMMKTQSTGTDAQQAKPAAQFTEDGPTMPDSFPDHDLLDSIGQNLTPEVMQLQMERLSQPVVELLQGVRSYEEALGAVAAVFPKMNTSDLQNTLEKLILLGEVVGRNSVAEEDRG